MRKEDELSIMQCSLLQFHNMRTKEHINIGFVLQDDSRIYLYAPISHPSLSRYLTAHSPESLSYAVEVYSSILKETGLLSGQKIGKFLAVTSPFPVQSRESGKKAVARFAKVYLTTDTDPFDETLVVTLDINKKHS